MEQIQRHFIRHPTTIPIQFAVGDTLEQLPAHDVTQGGLCFTCSHAIPTHQRIYIVISDCDPVFEAEGIVKWCKSEGESFLIGIAFEDEAVRYAVRMVEQVCHIENFRKQLQQQHDIHLTSHQAAQLWIQIYAADFPNECL